MKNLFYFLLLLIISMFCMNANANDTITVDNRDSSVERSGWWAKSGGANPYASDSEYAVGSSTFTWNVDLPRAGEYEIQVYWTPWSNRTTFAQYTVNDSNFYYLDQRSGGAEWVSISQLSLNAGTNTVTVSNQLSGGTLSADAIRFVEIDVVSELVSEFTYFDTAGQELNAYVREYHTGEIFLFYNVKLNNYNVDNYYDDDGVKVLQLREHDPLDSAIATSGTPTSIIYLLDYRELYDIEDLNIVKNDNGQVLVSWIESSSGDNIGSIPGSQGYNTLKVSRIDLASGEVVQKQASSSTSYGTQKILLVGFSPDGSTADISVSRGDNPGLFSFEF